jgi:hypothetical protein
MAQRRKVGRHLELDCTDEGAVGEIRGRSQIEPDRSKKAVGSAAMARKTTTTTTVTCPQSRRSCVHATRGGLSGRGPQPEQHSQRS